MSEGPDRESKTEEATPRKLEQAREKGDGVKTMDLGSFATLATSSAVVLMAGGWLSRNMVAQLTPFFSHQRAVASVCRRWLSPCICSGVLNRM